MAYMNVVALSNLSISSITLYLLHCTTFSSHLSNFQKNKMQIILFSKCCYFFVKTCRNYKETRYFQVTESLKDDKICERKISPFYLTNDFYEKQLSQQTKHMRQI